jgi:hypothetical protein
MFLRRGYTTCASYPLVNVHLARERARRGDHDEAIPLMRATVDHLFRDGQLLLHGIGATGVLVETLLDRGADGDVAEAEAAIERLTAAPADRRCGDARHLAAAAASSTGAGSRRCHGLRAHSGPLPRHGDIAWLRRTYRVGRGDAMTAPRLVCGPCGTEFLPNTKSYNQSAVPELPGPVERQCSPLPACRTGRNGAGRSTL